MVVLNMVCTVDIICWLKVDDLCN